MRTKTGLLRLITITTLLSVLSGCAFISLHKDKYVRDKAGKDVSFVYGVLDMEDAPSWAPWVILRRIKPKTGRNEWIMRVSEGVIYMENLPAGTYQITRFGGSWGNTSYTYQMPNGADNVTTFSIKKPGVHYMGNFRYIETQNDKRYRGSGFDLVSMKKRTRSKPLQDIAKYVEGSSWEKEINKKLKKLAKKG